MESLADLLTVIGRLHPLIIHFPIGLIAGVVCLELWMVFRPDPRLRPATGALLAFAAAAALVAAVCGLLLARAGEYDQDSLSKHRLLGLTAAALVIAALVAHWRSWHSGPGLFRSVLVGCMLVIIAAGHYGGIMAHGEAPLSALTAAVRGLWQRTPEAAVATAQVDDLFHGSVAPILESHCHECHGAEKQKSGLRLDSRLAAMAGGESGKPVIVPGNAMKSELVEVITLPAGNKRAMPPTGKPRLEPAQVMAVIEWINRGASWPDKGDMRPAGVAPPSAAVLEQLRASGFHVGPLALGHPLVRVDRVPAGARLAALGPIAEQIAWLNLVGFLFEPGEARVLATMPHLSRLELQYSNVQDADMVEVAKLTNIRILNLYATHIGDQGVHHLHDLGSLARLYLWRTQVTPAGLQRLREALPSAQIDAGSSQDGPPGSATTASPAVF